MIEIIEQVRAMTGLDVKVHIGGNLEASPYVNEIKHMALMKPWIKLLGSLYGKDKEVFLASGTYALHAMREEAFGISITEYLKAGLIPIVPDEGGAREVVANPALTYHDKKEAAEILARLIKDDTFREAQRIQCEQRAKMFSVDAYLKRQHLVLQSIIRNNGNE